MAVSEYDAFGPWIYEITEEHPVPPLFKDYCPMAEDALLQLKLPREIERRKADPSMDLYDYVISADEDVLTVLKRQDKTVSEEQLAYTDIHAVRIARRFLKGTLELYTADGNLSVPFNTVSVKLIMKLVRIIRDRYITNRDTGIEHRDSISGMFAGADILFFNLIRDLKAEGEQLTEGAYQSSVPLIYKGRVMSERIKNHMQRPMTKSAVHLATPEELLIIEREQQDGKKKKQGYGYEYFYTPFNHISMAKLSLSKDYDGINQLCINSGNGSFNFYISANNRDVSGFYAELNERI